MQHFVQNVAFSFFMLLFTATEAGIPLLFAGICMFTDCIAAYEKILLIDYENPIHCATKEQRRNAALLLYMQSRRLFRHKYVIETNDSGFFPDGNEIKTAASAIYVYLMCC